MKRRARGILERASQKAAGDGDFAKDLAGLDAEMVIERDYATAANLGRKAVSDYALRPIDPHALGKVLADVRRPYAAAAVDAIVVHVTDAIDAELDARTDDPDWVDDAAARVGDTIDGQELAATRYGDAPWTAGQSGYANQLGEFEIRFVWVLDDEADHCEDCPELAAESEADPWTIENAPAYPGDGSTQCLDRCKCHIQADDASWAEAFPDQDG